MNLVEVAVTTKTDSDTLKKHSDHNFKSPKKHL